MRQDVPSLVEEYGITEETLAKRREFIRLGEEDRQILIQLIPWAEQVGPKIATDLYDWQFAFSGTRTFFEEFAADKRIPIATLRQELEKTQASYFIAIFTGARHHWGSQYFENRLNVGRIHDQINLPFKWYLGAYAEYQHLVRRRLSAAFRGGNSKWWVRKSGQASLDLEKAEEAIFKVFNYDIQAIGDSFLLNTVQSMGFSVSAIQADRGRDKTEHLAQIKQMVGTLLEQAKAISESRIHERVLEVAVPGQLGDASAGMVNNLKEFANHIVRTSAILNTIAAAAEEMNASIKEIAQNTVEANRVVTTSAEECARATGTVSKLGQSSVEIGGIIKIISSVADQTNLLALNATIEAAWAGEAGKGFAVVANEVKGLAKETTKSTEDINNKIGMIQQETKTATDAIAHIVQSVDHVNDVFSAMAAAVEEQTATTAEITRNVTEAAQISAEMAQRFQQSEGSDSHVASDRAGGTGVSRHGGLLKGLRYSSRPSQPTDQARSMMRTL